jgi:predicted small secreted protein
MVKTLCAAILIATLTACATYDGARQDVGTGVEKLGDWIKKK